MEISNFVLNKTELKAEEYKEIFKNKSLKRCDKYFLRLNKLKTNVEKIVKSFQPIPDEIIQDYQNNYIKFSRCFFNEKTIKEAKKDKINLKNFLQDMEATLEQIKGYKEKINGANFVLVFFFTESLITNYMTFLNLSEGICKDFISNYKKNIK